MKTILARTPEELDAVYRLRYFCYQRRGVIGERADCRFRDSFDDLPNQFSFLAHDDRDQPVATVRLSVVRPDWGWAESPACRVYGDHPALAMLTRTSFVEASRLCFARTARRDAFYNLLGNMAALGERCGVEWMAACPRVEHSETYQRLYGFRPLAEPRRYFGVSFETELLGIRLSEMKELAGRVKWMEKAWGDSRSTIFSLQYEKSTDSSKTRV